MGKSTRKKQEKSDAIDRKIMSQFVAHRVKKPMRGVVTAHTYGVMTPAIKHLTPYFIRDANDWTYKGKSARIEKQQLELLRHVCGIYPVPKFLEDVAIFSNIDERFIYWYVAVAQGDSLYKTCTTGILSKRETHLLLQAPTDLTIVQAIWWAKTVAICNDIGVGYRMARSGIAHRDYKDEFWVDVHRFFTNNPVSIKEMEDLTDYIMGERQNRTGWTIKKRSLESIRRKSDEWHRAQHKMTYIGGGSWNGMNIPSWEKTLGKFDPNPQKNNEIKWTIQQILTGNDLAREGQKMRHCVASYKHQCMSGHAAIFSMTSTTATRTDQRNVTIEVNVSSRRVAQVRGFGNRHPRPEKFLG